MDAENINVWRSKDVGTVLSDLERGLSQIAYDGVSRRCDAVAVLQDVDHAVAISQDFTKEIRNVLDLIRWSDTDVDCINE